MRKVRDTRAEIPRLSSVIRVCFRWQENLAADEIAESESVH
jgi:hypothetical protein